MLNFTVEPGNLGARNSEEQQENFVILRSVID